MRFAAVVLIIATTSQLGCDSQSHRSPGPATTASESFQPVWTVDVPAGVEWFRLLGDPASAIVLCDRVGTVQCIDPADGKITRLPAALTAPRPALPPVTSQPPATSRPSASSQPAEHAFYCYDSFSVAAIDVENAEVLWRVGAWPESDRQTQRDPEILDKLLAVRPVRGGALVVRNDGAVALLGAGDGMPRWRVQLTPTSECRIEARNSTAAIIYRRNNRVRVALLDLRDEPPAPRQVSIGNVTPFFSAFTSAGLVLGWSNRIAVVSTDGAVEPLAVSPAALISNASLQVVERPGGAATLLIAADTSGSIHAYDLSERKRIWSTKASTLDATAPGGETARGAHAVWTTVAASGDYVVAAGRSLYVVLDPASGRSLGRFESPEFDPLANAIVTRGDQIYVVGRSQPEKPDSPLSLWRDAPASGAARGQLVRLGILDRAARDVRAVDLVGGLLLIVEQNRVSAYTLP